MEDLKKKYNYDDCKCCDSCKHWRWKDGYMNSIICEKLNIDITDESNSRICDLYEKDN